MELQSQLKRKVDGSVEHKDVISTKTKLTMTRKEVWLPATLCVSQEFVHSITMDNNGIVYFTTGGHYMYYVKRDVYYAQPQMLVSPMVTQLRGIVCNGKNIIYACDHKGHRILAYSLDTKNFTVLTGGNEGHKDGNLKDAEFWFPQGITMDKNGDLYVTMYHCVRKISLSEGTVITIAGCRERGHNDGEAKVATFSAPTEIVVTDDNTIYVADEYNFCIRKIKDGIVSTVAGTGKEGRRDGPLNVAQFGCTRGLVLDRDGSLLVGQTGIRRVDLKQQVVSTLQAINTIAIYGLAWTDKGDLLAAGAYQIMKLQSCWKRQRWVWIGKLKEDPKECLLATLPQDTIKEIAQFLTSK